MKNTYEKKSRRGRGRGDEMENSKVEGPYRLKKLNGKFLVFNKNVRAHTFSTTFSFTH